MNRRIPSYSTKKRLDIFTHFARFGVHICEARNGRETAK